MSHIRNIAIIAHVDHGKTTLVDQLLRQAGTFRANETLTERVMDSNELERERGITILAKNTAVFYKGEKINIVDTPGHADFGGEVERALKMVDGVMLLVDASEGPLPQTRYVLSKALEATPPCRFSSSTKSTAPTRAPRKSSTRSTTSSSISTPLKISSTSRSSTPTPSSARPAPVPISPALTCSRSSTPSSRPFPPAKATPPASLQIQVANLDYSDYLGRLAIARVFNGTLHNGDEVAISKRDGSLHKTRITKLFTFSGLKRIDIDATEIGDIVAVAGVEGITIGETITDARESRTAARHHHRRAHHRHAVRRQHLAHGRTRRPVRHFAQPARAPRKGAAHERLHPRRRDRLARQLQGPRPRRVAARHPHRDDAPRRLRAHGRPARDRHQRSRRPSSWSRSSTSPSTSRKISSAPSSSASARARAKWSRCTTTATAASASSSASPRAVSSACAAICSPKRAAPS